MEDKKSKEQIYCIFNQTKENINKQIGKAFEIYLRELIKTKDNIEKNIQKDYNKF